MNTVKVRNITIGEGRPKICVPIVGKTREEILKEASTFSTLPVDVAEWRVDWYDDVFDTEEVLTTAKQLNEALGEIPVLFTFRTSKEGGEKEISPEQYAQLNNHDFAKTPEKDEIVRRLRKMQTLGADIPKIALMPTCKKDVLTLLEATLEMSEQYADRPIITMSMAGTGVVSRLTGETFGSALTFGAASKASAPGQIGVHELKQVLDIIHKSL